MRQQQERDFSNQRHLGYLRVAINSNLKKNIKDIKICTDFTMLEVKVLIIFSGTEDFC